MFIRSTILITLISVGVAGCQNRTKVSMASATISPLSEQAIVPVPVSTASISQDTPDDIPAPMPAPAVTASMPTAMPEQDIEPGRIDALTVPRPQVAEEIAPPVSVAPHSRSWGRGRVSHFGRKVIASRSRSRTQRVIIEDDLTRDNYELDSGDRIRLSVFEQRNLSRIYVIDAGGYISVPLIGNVSVRGLTTKGVEQAVADKLSEKYIRDPKVSVEINTYRPFYILGQVRNSGRFPFVNGMTVRSAVAVAGGYTARANKRKILLTRRLNAKRITTYVQPGYYIRPGDTLEIRERFF